MPSRPTTAISVVLAAAIGWLGAVAYQAGAQQPAKKPGSTTAENRQNKELQKLSQPPSESIHKTSRGELLVLGVNTKPKYGSVERVACFVWIGNAGQTAMDCPQNPIEVDEPAHQDDGTQADALPY